MNQIDFSSSRVARSILRSALPLLVAQFVNLLYNIVDRIYIGRIPGIGPEALGGIGLTFPIILFALAFTTMFGAGGAPLCAIERGKGRPDEAARVMNSAAFLLLVTGIVLTVLGELFAKGLLYAFGASGESIRYALPYLRIYLTGTVFSMLATGLNPYVNAQGFAKVGMATVVIGAILNLLLDPLFIFPLGLGIRGAAYATILSQLVSALFVIRFLTGPRAELRLRLLRPGEVRANLPVMGNIVSLGTSSFIMQITNSLVSIVCNRTLSQYGGDLYVSVMTVISSVRQILETPVLAVADGTSPVMSFNYGAKQPGHVRKAIFYMTAAAVLYTAAAWLLVLVRPSLFIRIFTDDPSMIEAAVPALHIYFFAFIFQSLQASGQSVFKSLNKKKRAIFFSLFRKVVMVVPLTFLLPRIGGLGVNGVFWAEPISNFVGGTACFVTMLLTILPELRGMKEN